VPPFPSTGRIIEMIKKIIFWILIAAVLLTIGCSKLTTENYNRLRIGMNYDKVVSLLGTADQCDGAMGFKNCMWGNKKRNIKVSFAGEKVVVFSGHGL
jgi:hypothetical protein